MLMCTSSSDGLSPQELVQTGFRDLVSPFLKDEPHPPRKVDVGAWRVVQCVSLVDQIVERVIYSRPVQSIKRLYPTSDAVVGIGFSDEQTAEFHDQVVRDLGDDFTSTDVSGWDRVLGAGWVLEAGESIIRSSRCQVPAWQNAVRNHVYGLVRPVFIVPRGRKHVLVQRPEPGGMLSGSFMTTTLNTLARLDVSRQAGSLRAKAAGDDCLEQFREGVDFIESYASLGFTIRQSGLHEADCFEFCSHEYSVDAPDRCPLTSWLKLLLRYFLLPVITSEQYTAALHELRHNREFGRLRPLIEARYNELSQAAREARAVQNSTATKSE